MEMSIRHKKRAGTRENILGQLEDYSKGADSEQMFSGLQISREADFKKHLNKYDVIRVTLEHNCIIKKHKIQRLPQVSRLRHFAVCTKNTENILEKEREKGIMSEKV